MDDDPTLLINILAPETTTMTDSNPAIAILSTLATQEREEAVRELDALVRSLQALTVMVKESHDISWHAEGIDSRKASAAVSRLALSEANIARVRSAVDFANR